MTPNRIAVGVLTLVLLALLGWSIFTGAGDVRTWVMLALGAALGGLYTAFGRLPSWIVDHCGGCVTQEDSPSNISARVSLPILLGVIAVAVVAFMVAVRLL